MKADLNEYLDHNLVAPTTSKLVEAPLQSRLLGLSQAKILEKRAKL